jgi:hypothetical protein
MPTATPVGQPSAACSATSREYIAANPPLAAVGHVRACSVGAGVSVGVMVNEGVSVGVRVAPRVGVAVGMVGTNSGVRTEVGAMPRTGVLVGVMLGSAGVAVTMIGVWVAGSSIRRQPDKNNDPTSSNPITR